MMKQEQAGEQPERQVGESKSVLEDSTPSRKRIELYTGDESHVMNGSRQKLYCPLNVEPSRTIKFSFTYHFYNIAVISKVP